MLDKVKKSLPQILQVGIYLALFTSLLYPYRDKDWGWHYRYGQYFLEHGEFLIRDIYSWTLAGYAWINHSWAFDPLLYILFNQVGYLGLSLAAALIALTCFHLITRGYKLVYWQLAICAFFFQKLVETGIREGLRSQVLALLPLALLMYLLKRARDNPKWLRTLPFLFLIWANLHGTFVFGLGIMGIFYAVFFFQYPKHRRALVSTGVATLLLTLISPFTYHSYLEVLRHTSSPYLQNIFEWLPIYYNCADCHVPTFGTYLAILLTALIFKPQKTELPFFLIMLALTWQTVAERRYLPLLGITTLPLLASLFERMKLKSLDLSQYKIMPYLTLFLIMVTLEYNLFSRLPSYNYYHYAEAEYCQLASHCSPAALEYLKAHPPVGNGFNFYDWGGYLIGKGLPAKVFVDGRMHLWQVKDYSPFGDYISMYYQNNKDLFIKYDFHWALVESGSPVSQLIESGTVGRWQLSYYDNSTRYYVRQP